MSKRICKELDDFVSTDNFQFVTQQISTIWEVTAPENSPYAGTKYKLYIIYPADYPFKPPAVKFITDIFHPNVVDGYLTIVELREQWSPAIHLDGLSIIIQSIFTDFQYTRFMNRDAISVFEDVTDVSSDKGKDQVNDKGKDEDDAYLIV